MRGSFAALFGSTIIAVLFWLMVSDVSLIIMITIAITGFLGCFIDSLLGAKLQGKSLKLPLLSNNENGTVTVNNNIVNWLSTGSASVLVLLITLII